MTSRRGFLTSILGAAAGTAVAEEMVSPPVTDPAWGIEQLLDWYGEDLVCSELRGLVDLRELRRRCGRIAQRERRASRARVRREVHDDTIVWRGRLAIGGLETWLQELPRDPHYDGRGRRGIRKSVMPWQLEIVAYDDTGSVETYEVPAGSRLVMDLRRPLGEICTAELVECIGRPRRLHLWTRSGERYDERDGRLERPFGVRLALA